MKVLSLFDGLSGGRIALDELNVNCIYYASEIDKYAEIVSGANYPDIIRLGDVRELSTTHLPKIDLLIGGSPCQDLSSLKNNRKGLQGDKSVLFYQFARIKEELNPTYFVLENVNMTGKSAKDKDIITDILGVEPLLINSDRFVQQNRPRLYWTNIPVDLQQLQQRAAWDGEYWQYRRTYWRQNKSGVCPTLTANMGTGGNNVPYMGKKRIKMSPDICSKHQGIPIGYTSYVSISQQYKMIGNAFTVPVIKFILNFMLKNLQDSK